VLYVVQHSYDNKEEQDNKQDCLCLLSCRTRLPWQELLLSLSCLVSFQLAEVSLDFGSVKTNVSVR
jgi:hypothetical protein